MCWPVAPADADAQGRAGSAASHGLPRRNIAERFGRGRTPTTGKAAHVRPARPPSLSFAHHSREAIWCMPVVVRKVKGAGWVTWIAAALSPPPLNRDSLSCGVAQGGKFPSFFLNQLSRLMKFTTVQEVCCALPKPAVGERSFVAGALFSAMPFPWSGSLFVACAAFWLSLESGPRCVVLAAHVYLALPGRFVR